MWQCKCGFTQADSHKCNLCGCALEVEEVEEVEDNGIDPHELKEILDNIEDLVSKARRLIKIRRLKL